MRLTVLLIALAAWAGALSPTACAAGSVPMGGGVGIRVGGTPCTLTTIGHDRAGALIGFTSASCGGPGAPVEAEGSPGTRGTVTTTDAGLDYAVITFDPAEVTPVPDFAGFPINGIGPDATWGQQACRDSRTTGVVCGRVSVAGADPDTVLFHKCGDPGDSGAAVTVNALLVGMIRGGFEQIGSCPVFIGTYWEVPTRNRPEITSINAILDDINAKGGPGAGFTPVGA